MDTSFAEPSLLAMLQSAVAMYHTDSFASHLTGIPFVARMGGIDDNVNPWNLRRFARLVDQANGQPGWSSVYEAPGQGHWFDGVMDADVMTAFYNKCAPVPSF